MMLLLALVGFGITLGLLCLGIIGAILTIALRILTAILWVAIKILEHRKSEPEIFIIVECPMRDVTPRNSTRASRAAQGD